MTLLILLSLIPLTKEIATGWAAASSAYLEVYPARQTWLLWQLPPRPIISRVLLGRPLPCSGTSSEGDYEMFWLYGCLAGIVGVSLTTLGVILCLRRHRKRKPGEVFVINKAKILEGKSHTVPTQDSHNTYVKDTEAAVPTGSACHQHNEPQTSQQRKVSISSDYTESHYYTEIDEYFINKRIAKKQKKNCYEKKSFEKDTSTPENKINIETNVYDYAYGMRPHK